jgi:hypothetical protein
LGWRRIQTVTVARVLPAIDIANRAVGSGQTLGSDLDATSNNN